MQNLKNDCIYHAIEKIEEIQEELFNYPCTSNYLEYYWADLHHYLFNEDYFLIGFYKCKKWLGDNLLNAINLVKDYELFNLANEHIALNELDLALIELDKIEVLFPSSLYSNKSLLVRAYIHFLKKDYETTRVLAENFKSYYPGNSDIIYANYL